MSSETSLMWTKPVVADPVGAFRWRDRIFAAVVLVLVVVEAFSRLDPGWRPAAIGVGVVLAVAVLLRRVHPLTAVALGFGTFLVVDLAAAALGAASLVLYSGVVVVMLVYSLFRWGAGRDVALGAAIVTLEFTVSTITNFTGAEDAVGGAAVLLLAGALGVALRYRMVARDQMMEQVRLREREHLARELHDMVAHHVSAIAVQAQAGLVLARSSDSAVIEALRTIDDEAVKTLEEMRTMVGILRDRGHQPRRSPLRHLADIESLASQRDDSPHVSVELRGDLTNLPVGVEAALFRVAQEAVTNARRHARSATRVEVTVMSSEKDLRLVVSNDGERTAAPKTRGFGMIGMSERVALLGGTLETGPQPDGGWRVQVLIPRQERTTT